MKRYKKKKIIIAFIALIALSLMSAYIFITTWQAKTYEEVQIMYPLSKSKNPKASEEFLKAMEYRIYIKELHPFFDYDSFVMAPLLEKLDYHFKKGKALLPKESVEDIVWWTLFYKEIYGLLVPPRNNNSLAYENLPYQEFAIVHDEVYEMIMRYPNGEVDFDLKEIEQFRFKAMAILVGFYKRRFSNRYDAISAKKRARAESLDVNATYWLTNIKNRFSEVYKKYINTSKDKEFMQREYWTDTIYIITNLIVKFTVINNTQDLPSYIYHSEDTQFILEHTNTLINYVNNNTNNQAYTIDASLFKPRYTNAYKIFKILEYKCMNLRPKIGVINQRVEQLNKNRK